MYFLFSLVFRAQNYLVFYDTNLILVLILYRCIYWYCFPTCGRFIIFRKPSSQVNTLFTFHNRRVCVCLVNTTLSGLVTRTFWILTRIPKRSFYFRIQGYTAVLVFTCYLLILQCSPFSFVLRFHYLPCSPTPFPDA